VIFVYGASDDITVIDGDVRNEVGRGRTITIGDERQGVRVTMKYAAAKTATWRACVEQIDEGVPMFPVTLVLADPHGYPDPQSYSVKVCVDCPSGTTVRCGKKTLGVRP